MADTTSSGQSSSYQGLNSNAAPTFSNTSNNDSAQAQAANLKDTVVNSEVRWKSWQIQKGCGEGMCFERRSGLCDFHMSKLQPWPLHICVRPQYTELTPGTVTNDIMCCHSPILIITRRTIRHECSCKPPSHPKHHTRFGKLDCRQQLLPEFLLTCLQCHHVYNASSPRD